MRPSIDEARNAGRTSHSSHTRTRSSLFTSIASGGQLLRPSSAWLRRSNENGKKSSYLSNEAAASAASLTSSHVSPDESKSKGKAVRVVTEEPAEAGSSSQNNSSPRPLPSLRAPFSLRKKSKANLADQYETDLLAISPSESTNTSSIPRSSPASGSTDYFAPRESTSRESRDFRGQQRKREGRSSRLAFDRQREIPEYDRPESSAASSPRTSQSSRIWHKVLNRREGTGEGASSKQGLSVDSLNRSHLPASPRASVSGRRSMAIARDAMPSTVKIPSSSLVEGNSSTQATSRDSMSTVGSRENGKHVTPRGRRGSVTPIPGDGSTPSKRSIVESSRLYNEKMKSSDALPRADDPLVSAASVLSPTRPSVDDTLRKQASPLSDGRPSLCSEDALWLSAQDATSPVTMDGRDGNSSNMTQSPAVPSSSQPLRSPVSMSSADAPPLTSVPRRSYSRRGSLSRTLATVFDPRPSVSDHLEDMPKRPLVPPSRSLSQISKLSGPISAHPGSSSQSGTTSPVTAMSHFSSCEEIVRDSIDGSSKNGKSISSNSSPSRYDLRSSAGSPRSPKRSSSLQEAHSPSKTKTRSMGSGVLRRDEPRSTKTLEAALEASESTTDDANTFQSSKARSAPKAASTTSKSSLLASGAALARSRKKSLPAVPVAKNVARETKRSKPLALNQDVPPRARSNEIASALRSKERSAQPSEIKVGQGMPRPVQPRPASSLGLRTLDPDSKSADELSGARLQDLDDQAFLNVLEKARQRHRDELARETKTAKRVSSIATIGIAPQSEPSNVSKDDRQDSYTSHGSENSAEVASSPALSRPPLLKRSSSADAKVGVRSLSGPAGETSFTSSLPSAIGWASGQAQVKTAFANDEDWKKEVRALFVIRELLTTEQSYAQHLENLLQAVRKKATSSGAPVSTLGGPAGTRRKSVSTLTSMAPATLTNKSAASLAAISDRHLPLMRNLLPQLIALSRTLTSKIDANPTAAGVGLAFALIAPQLEATFVAWSTSATEIMEGLRATHGPKAKAKDKLSLVNAVPRTFDSGQLGAPATSHLSPSPQPMSPVSHRHAEVTSGMSMTRPPSPTSATFSDEIKRPSSSLSVLRPSRRRSTVSNVSSEPPSAKVSRSPKFDERESAAEKSGSDVGAAVASVSPISRPASPWGFGTRRRSASKSHAKKPSLTASASVADLPSIDGVQTPAQSVSGLNSQSGGSTKALSAIDVAIMPLQRPPRYLLLLIELLRNTPQSSVSHARVTRSLEVVRAVAHRCDQASPKGSSHLTTAAGGSTKAPSTATTTTRASLDGNMTPTLRSRASVPGLSVVRAGKS